MEPASTLVFGSGALRSSSRSASAALTAHAKSSDLLRPSGASMVTIMRRAGALLLAALALGACGDDGASEPAGTGGNLGTGGDSTDAGGTGGASSGTGGDASGTGGGTAARVRGAASFHVLTGTGCSLDEQYQDFPTLDAGHPVTATEKLQAVEDGSTTTAGEPIDVLCSWADTEPWDSFDAVIKIGPAGDQRFANIGAAIRPGEEVLGGIAFQNPEWARTYGSSPDDPCRYTVIEADAITRSIWGSIECGIFGPNDGSDQCALGPSYFFFENCTLR